MTRHHDAGMASTGVRWGSGLVWAWSWYTMYLEIFRWKHVTPLFRFNPGPPIPGTDIRVKPGMPLKFLYVCFFAAPVVFVATTWRRRNKAP